MKHIGIVCAAMSTLAALTLSSQIAEAGNLTIHTPPPPKVNVATPHVSTGGHFSEWGVGRGIHAGSAGSGGGAGKGKMNTEGIGSHEKFNTLHPLNPQPLPPG